MRLVLVRQPASLQQHPVFDVVLLLPLDARRLGLYSLGTVLWNSWHMDWKVSQQVCG